MTTITETDTMLAAVYRRFGGPEVVHVERVPKPTPRADEVLIRAHASTVSIADYRCRSKDLPDGLAIFGPLSIGAFRPRKRILGMDVAGVVEAVGADVTRFAVGDRVIALRGSRFGCHAEYVTMPQDGAIAIAPTNLSLEDSVSLVFGGTTARVFFNLAEARGALKPGAEVLVNGASGSTGSAAVQLAKSLGARVTGVSSQRNHALVRSLGADELIDYSTTDFAADGKQYDVVVDTVGNAPFRRAGGSVKPGGALLLVVGSLASMLTAKRDSRRSGKLVAMLTPPATASDLEYLVRLAEKGELTPVVDRTYTLDEITAAHEYVGTWRKRGNLVLKLA